MIYFCGSYIQFMTHFFSSDFTLGILGGGQLGKMLLYETRKFDIKTHVLDPSAEAPCKIACDVFKQGSLMDFDTVYSFGKKVDVLTFEIENVNIEALEKLENEGVTVYPSPKTLRNINNKSIQKEFYKKHKIPTAPFHIFDTIQQIKEAISSQTIELPFVWKSSTGGYDGMGVSVIRTIEDLNKLKDQSCICEDLIPFKNELAVIVARSPNGEIATYPFIQKPTK
jgi:5-(carboxyamino)imidazole ribonucleotide synthase